MPDIVIQAVQRDAAQKLAEQFHVRGISTHFHHGEAGNSRDSLALAVKDSSLAGCVSLALDSPGESSVVDVRGGVLPEYRSCGIGSALFDWVAGEGLSFLGVGSAELVVDDSQQDSELRKFLSKRGFHEEIYAEMRADSQDFHTVPLVDNMHVRNMTARDLHEAAFIYASMRSGSITVSSAEKDLRLLWAQPDVHHKECHWLVLDGFPCGFVVVRRWHSEPTCLWVECLAVSPAALDLKHQCASVLLAEVRKCARTGECVGIGSELGSMQTFSENGFRVSNQWSRYRQLLVA